MKAKAPQSSMRRRFAPFWIPVAAACAALVAFPHPGKADDRIKAGNTDNLNLTTSWVGGIVPDSNDVGVWDDTVTGPNPTVLGADMSWQAIRIGGTTQTGLVTIGAGNTLTLAPPGVPGPPETPGTGIDMSSAPRNLTIASGITIGADQLWNVGAGRTLNFTASAGNVLAGSADLTKTGAGTLQTASGASSTFSGIFTIAEGRWISAGGSAFITSGQVVLKDGVRVENSGAAASTLTGGSAITHLDGNVTLVGTTGGTADTTRLVFGTSTGSAVNLRPEVGTNVTVNVENAPVGPNLLGGYIDFQGVSQTTAGTSLTKTGPGILRISRASTYSGGTTINEGTLQLPSTGGIIGNVVVNSNSRLLNEVANLNLGAGSQFTLSGGVFTSSRRTTLTASSYVLESGTMAEARLLGAGSTLTKTTAGTITLGNLNTYTGTTTLAGGVLVLEAGEVSAQSQSVTTTSGSTTLVVEDSSVLQVGQYVGGAGPMGFGNNNYIVSIDSPTTVTLAGAATASNTGTGSFSAGGALGRIGTIEFTGGTLRYSTANQVDYSGRFSSAAGQQYRIDTNGQSVTFGTALTSSGGSLTKLGTGVLTLGAANSYTGATMVSAGTLLVNGSIGAASNVTVEAGGILGGSGTINGITSISGSLRPGNSIGTLTVANDVTWNGGVDWVFELGPSDTSDLLDITGASSDFLKGTGSSWRFDFAGSTDAGTFTLVQWGGTTDFDISDFSYTNLGGSNTGSFSFDGNSLQFTAIPEPGSAGLIIGGLALLLLARRRQG